MKIANIKPRVEKKAAKPKNDLTAYDACVFMHTALRKCCDSKATSAAYNLVHVIGHLNLPEALNPWVASSAFSKIRKSLERSSTRNCAA